MNITYEEFFPSPVLSEVIDLYWFTSCNGTPSDISPIQHCLPHGMVELIIHLNGGRSKGFVKDRWVLFPESCLVGVMEFPVIWNMMGGTAMFGIRFKPEGISRLLRSPISELANSFIDANLFLDKKISSILCNLQEAPDNQTRIFFMEAFLQNQLSHLRRQHYHLSAAVNLIRNGEPGCSVGELSKAVYISERQLQRVFKENLEI